MSQRKEITSRNEAKIDQRLHVNFAAALPVNLNLILLDLAFGSDIGTEKLRSPFVEQRIKIKFGGV